MSRTSQPPKKADPRRVALVVKRTTYDLVRDEPEDRFHRLLAQGDPTVANVITAHEEHTATVAEVKQALAEMNVQVTRIRKRSEELANGEYDLVVTVGGDGTLLRASHGVGSTPIIGINSAPSFSVGFFCAERKDGDLVKTFRAALRGKLPRATLTRMRVALNDKTIHQRVLNDALFCHQSPAATSRYIMEHEGHVEEQKSSGFWISPAAGSTAAQRSAGGNALPFASKNLQCVVRELYAPRGYKPKLQTFTVRMGSSLSVRSKSRRMRLYIDGPDTMIKVGLGDIVNFTQSPEPLTLYGVSARRKWLEAAERPSRSPKPPVGK